MQHSSMSPLDEQQVNQVEALTTLAEAIASDGVSSNHILACAIVSCEDEELEMADRIREAMEVFADALSSFTDVTPLVEFLAKLSVEIQDA